MASFNTPPDTVLRQYYEDLTNIDDGSGAAVLKSQSQSQPQPQPESLAPGHLAVIEESSRPDTEELFTATRQQVTPTLLTDEFLVTFAPATPLESRPAPDETITAEHQTDHGDKGSVDHSLKEIEARQQQGHTVDAIAVSNCDRQEKEAIDSETIDPEQLQWLENNRPPWAQSNFDALLLEVADFKIAVPLITLGHIHPLSDTLTLLFGQADWFMGLQTEGDRQLRVLNTALFTMPERYSAAFLDTARYVVSINGLSWALAVSKVNQPIRLKPTEVRWRSHREKQPWAAGVVKEHMCVLIDIPRLGQMLLDSDQRTSLESD